ncbi:MAG: AAA family ATPase [Desulfobacterales bacterium]|nr:MAG: AAA family ATPase [Desulfobacterales bacterium]
MNGNQSNSAGIICPSCRHKNPQEAKFCQQCGLKLHQICTNCQTAMSPDAKFCYRCGQAAGTAGVRSQAGRAYTPQYLADKILTTRSALEGERKQVTVLFADIKGSMQLAEQVDPEEWHAILDDFFQILAAGIHRFEGTINQYTGDGIMALFGAPLAHEDHALRACYAALYLRKALRSHADQLRVKRGLNFGVRMGLNSGEVVVGRIGDDLRMDYTAQGQTVGLAARMEQLAESGCVYITEHTRTLVEGFFKLRDLGLSSIKGVTQPVRIYELEEIREYRTRLDISQERGFSRFIGRSNEMAVLLSAHQRALAGHGNVIGIVGEPGVGKSRLCYEFLELNRKTGITICEANCASHIKTIPLLPVLQLLRSFFGIAIQEREEDARKKIAGTLILLDEAFKDTLSIWFDFLSVADRKQPAIDANGEERQRKLFALIQRLIQTMSKREPLIMLVEDLHWIDSSSDTFIDRLVDAVSDTRTLLLLNFRPEYRREWMNRSIYRRLPLPALDDAASRELLEDLLGSDPSLENLTPKLASRALGNPYFIEELVRSLVESGNLAGQRSAYRLVKPLKTQTLPRTVQAVLSARIDRLAEPVKQVLQSASVVGQEFEAVILRQALDLSDRELEDSLYALQEVEFFYQKAFYPVPMYAFKHPILREVAYHSLLTKQRARLHRRMARAIEITYPDRKDELAGLVAHHWENANKPLKAARRHRRAARASGFAEVHRTFFHWTKALKLVHQAPANEEALRLQLEACCGALDIGGRVDVSPKQVREIFEEGRQQAEKFGDFRSLLRLHEDMAARLGWSGDFAGQRRYLNEAMIIAEKVADPEIKIGLLQRRYVAEFHQGDLRSALNMAEEGIARCEASRSALPDPVHGRLLRAFLLAKANVLTLMGKLDEAGSLIDQAAHLLPSDEKSKKDSRTTHTGALVRAHLSFYVGNSDAGLRDARVFVELAERSGSTWAIAVSASTLGRAHIMGRRWSEAREALEYALAQARQHKLGLEAEASYLAFLAEALAGCEELKQALETAEEAVAAARRKGTLFWELQAQTALATILLHRGRLEDQHRIAEILDLAAGLIEKTGGQVMKPLVTMRRAEFAEMTGNKAGHLRLLKKAHNLYTAMAAHGYAEQLAAKLRGICPPKA